MIHDDSKMFRECFFFVFGFIGLSFYLHFELMTIFKFLAIIGSILLILTGYDICTLSKSSKISHQAWIEAQKKRKVFDLPELV